MGLWIKRIVLLLMVVALASPLGACGRKGKPEHPEGSDFPREYPAKR